MTREDDRRRKPANRWGCKPCEDVCLEHDAPLDCRHGCDHAKGHECSGSRDTTIIKDPPADAVVDLFDALKSVVKKQKQPASKAGPNG